MRANKARLSVLSGENCVVAPERGWRTKRAPDRDVAISPSPSSCGLYLFPVWNRISRVLTVKKEILRNRRNRTRFLKRRYDTNAWAGRYYRLEFCRIMLKT